MARPPMIARLEKHIDDCLYHGRQQLILVDHMNSHVARERVLAAAERQILMARRACEFGMRFHHRWSKEAARA